MTDVFSPEKRSQVMQKVRSKDTKPEMVIRRGIHSLGYRFRLHDKNLPGKPDIVLAKYRAVIQVMGCFWHGHDCNDGHIPKSRQDYWIPKLEANKKRDLNNNRLLESMGWKVIVVWECSCLKKKDLENELKRIDTELNKRKTELEKA